MNENNAAMAVGEPTAKSVSMDEYRAALKTFDACVCEALAVSQAIGSRIAALHAGYATHVFALVRAAPKSRWTRTESEFWDFSAIAGHSRSIIEGQLLLHYVAKTPEDLEEWSVRLNVMHLNDCSRRIKILDGVVDPAEIMAFSVQAEEIRERLRGNSWFLKLDQKVQKRLLSGDSLTITTCDEQLEELGWDKREFYTLWNLLSQYTHVLPLSFYRL